jgi:DNA-binding response OmpR family regulator
MSADHDAGESLRGLRIMLVEDDPLISLDLEVSLSELGAIVTPASSVPDALNIMASAPLDFAVLDFERGALTSEAIAHAAIARNVPFLYLSGYSERDERFARWPGIDVLAKPISLRTLARHIRETLARRA